MAKTNKKCINVDCSKEVQARGLCMFHYDQWRKRGIGDALESQQSGFIKDPIDRLWSRVDKTGDGCWLWIGCCNNRGYGQMRIKGIICFGSSLSFL